MSMVLELSDSRRLTGPNLLMDRAGAVVDVAIEGVPVETVSAAWAAQARRLLEAVGWGGEATYTRSFRGGASLALSAPIDALYAATEVNEAAWERAVAALMGETPNDEEAAVARLKTLIEDERNPALLRLRAAARQHGVGFLADDEHVSAGLGAGAVVWPADALPDPAEVDWNAASDIPVALITGTNGKSTTVRLLAAIVEAAGKTAGLTSTDFIRVGDTILDRGDYSGPGGARTLLRDRRVEVGLLEVARGGILRRGLALDHAGAALITNVAEDHLGEYGINTLDELIQAKSVVRRVLGSNGVLVLNADDIGLVAHAGTMNATLCWFSLDAQSPVVRAHQAAGGRVCFVDDGRIVYAEGTKHEIVAAVDALPITLGGAARHNVANSLGAVGLAKALGLATHAITEGLHTFRSDAADNPGRGNLFTVDGATVLVDFAHNPHGLAAIIDTVRRLPAHRRLVMLGQAGDRSDDDIRNLAHAAWQIHPDHIVIMALEDYRRGRPEGEVPALLHNTFLRLGAVEGHITHTATCLDGVKAALAWAAPGDVLLLLVLTQREAVFRLLEEAQTAA